MRAESVRAERAVPWTMIALALALAFVAACDRAAAGGPGERDIGAATGSIGELEPMWNLVELADGRVAFAQARVPAVIRADFASGKLETIGRKGSGPGEYQAPGRVHLSHGRLGAFDFQLYRLTTWNDDGTVLESSTIPPRATFAMQLDTLGHARPLPIAPRDLRELLADVAGQHPSLAPHGEGAIINVSSIA